MPSRGKESYSIQSVENALDVLEALCDFEDEVRISALSEKLGMNKTSVFRLLATFENRGYVEKEKGNGKYRLGLSAYEIGQKLLSRMGLLQKARPVMEKLVRECNEAVYLTVKRGEDVLFLEMVDTSQQVKIIPLTGNRYPLARNAAGKVILAHSPGTPLEPGRAMPPGSPLPSPEELLQIRQQGHCIDIQSLGEGVTSLAIPIFGGEGDMPGCLCMVGPDFRMSPETITGELLPRLKEAGETVSSKLGYLGSYWAETHFQR